MHLVFAISRLSIKIRAEIVGSTQLKHYPFWEVIIICNDCKRVNYTVFSKKKVTFLKIFYNLLNFFFINHKFGNLTFVFAEETSILKRKSQSCSCKK